MATKKFVANAAGIAEVHTIVIGGTWANADTVILTLNNKTLIVTFGNGIPTTAQVAAAIKSAWQGEAVTSYGETRNFTGNNVPDYAEITATVSSSTVTLTHKVKGTPFTLATTETSGSGTVADSTTVAARGPYMFDDADNWDTNGIPADGDFLVFENFIVTDGGLLQNLSQAAISPATIDVKMNFQGKIGLPQFNSKGYYEYRTTYLTLADVAQACTITVGQGDGSGSGLLKFARGAAQTTLNVYNTGAPAEIGVPALLFTGTHASNAATITKGSVGFAQFASETTTLLTLTIGYAGAQDTDADVRTSAGVTLGTLTQRGGTFNSYAGCTTANVSGGKWYAYGGTVTTVNVSDKGKVIWKGAGTITTLNINSGGEFDADQGDGDFAITNPIIMKAGAIFRNKKDRINTSGAVAITLSGCNLADVTIEMPNSWVGSFTI